MGFSLYSTEKIPSIKYLQETWDCKGPSESLNPDLAKNDVSNMICKYSAWTPGNSS